MAPMSRKRPSPTSTDLGEGVSENGRQLPPTVQQGLASQLLELIENKTEKTRRFQHFSGSDNEFLLQNGIVQLPPDYACTFDATKDPPWNISWSEGEGEGDLNDVILTAKGLGGRPVVHAATSFLPMDSPTHTPARMPMELNIQNAEGNGLLDASLADNGAVLEDLQEALLKGDYGFGLSNEFEVDQQWERHGSDNLFPFGLDMNMDLENVNLEVAQLLHEVDALMPAVPALNSDGNMQTETFLRSGDQPGEVGLAPRSFRTLRGLQAQYGSHLLNAPSPDVYRVDSGESTVGNSRQVQKSNAQGLSLGRGQTFQSEVEDMRVPKPLQSQSGDHSVVNPAKIHVFEMSNQLQVNRRMPHLERPPETSANFSPSPIPGNGRFSHGCQSPVHGQYIFQEAAEPAHSGTSNGVGQESDLAEMSHSLHPNVSPGRDPGELGSSNGASMEGSMAAGGHSHIRSPNVYVHLRESSPTAVHFEDLASRYEGEQWGIGGDFSLPGVMPMESTVAAPHSRSSLTGHMSAPRAGLQQHAAASYSKQWQPTMQAVDSAQFDSRTNPDHLIQPCGNGGFQVSTMRRSDGAMGMMAQRMDASMGMSTSCSERMMDGGSARDLGQSSTEGATYGANGGTTSEADPGEMGGEALATDLVPDPRFRPITSQAEQLLLECAEAIDRSDLLAAHKIMQVLNSMVSPHGTAEQRMAYYFLEGLAARIVGTGSAIYSALQSRSGSESGPGSKEMLAALLVFLEACPYANFGHVAANGAILEAFEGESHVHIIDFGITHGTQWPTLIESLAMRPEGAPHLRITAIDAPQTGLKPSSMQETGRRLTNFSKLMGVPFEFHAVTEHLESVQPQQLDLRPGEALAVNCVLRLHQLLDENRSLHLPSPRNQTLKMIHSLAPKVVTLVEQHTDHNLHIFTARFREAIHYYNALFDSLDMSLPWHSTERVLIEERVLGRKIVNIVACEGRERIERHESVERWNYRMRRAGLEPMPLSEDVVDNIQSLLKRYREGYGLDQENMSVLLTWRGQRLLAASTWRCAQNRG